MTSLAHSGLENIFFFHAALQDEGGKQSPVWRVDAINDFNDLGLDPDNQPHMHQFIRLAAS